MERSDANKSYTRNNESPLGLLCLPKMRARQTSNVVSSNKKKYRKKSETNIDDA